MPAGGRPTSSRTPATIGIARRRSRGSAGGLGNPDGDGDGRRDDAHGRRGERRGCGRGRRDDRGRRERSDERAEASPSAPAVFALTSSSGLAATAGEQRQDRRPDERAAAEASATAANTSTVASARLAAATSAAPPARTRSWRSARAPGRLKAEVVDEQVDDAVAGITASARRGPPARRRPPRTRRAARRRAAPSPRRHPGSSTPRASGCRGSRRTSGERPGARASGGRRWPARSADLAHQAGSRTERDPGRRRCRPASAGAIAPGRARRRGSP